MKGIYHLVKKKNTSLFLLAIVMLAKLHSFGDLSKASFSPRKAPKSPQLISGSKILPSKANQLSFIFGTQLDNRNIDQ